MSLATPPKIRSLQEALYGKVKREPDCRFHFLYDKVYRADMLAHAYALSRSHGGAPGVDGEGFPDIEAYGVERWLGEVRKELHTGKYKPQAVRRVMIPKPGGVGEHPDDPRSRGADGGAARPGADLRGGLCATRRCLLGEVQDITGLLSQQGPRSWGQPDPGGAGEGGSSTDNVAETWYCQTRRTR